MTSPKLPPGHYGYDGYDLDYNEKVASREAEIDRLPWRQEFVYYKPSETGYDPAVGVMDDGKVLDRLAALYGNQLRELDRLAALYGNQLRDRVRQTTTSMPQGNPMTKVWRIRQKSTGLFWNDVRWAELVGHFAELRVVDMDDEREMVQLQAQAQAPATSLASVLASVPRVGSRIRLLAGVSSAFAGKTGVVTGVDGIVVNFRLDSLQGLPELDAGNSPWAVHVNNVEIIEAHTPRQFEGDYDRYGNYGKRPETCAIWPTHPTGVNLISGSIRKERSIRLHGMPVSGENLYSGTFRADNGFSYTGVHTGGVGGTWHWQ
jgi:hypothetical protein